MALRNNEEENVEYLTCQFSALDQSPLEHNHPFFITYIFNVLSST